MEQRQTIPNDSSGAASPPPPWMHRAAAHPPDRRARMLEHMARARSLPQPQAAALRPTAKTPLAAGLAILGDACGYAILFGTITLLFQSHVPLYLGAFLFLADGKRIESLLGAIGLRFEPDAIGPDIVKGCAFWFAWIALLVSLRGSAPAWLAPWMPPAESWASIAVIILALAAFDAVAALAIRRAGARFGLAIRPDSLIWTTIKFAIVVGLLALLVLLGAVLTPPPGNAPRCDFVPRVVAPSSLPAFTGNLPPLMSAGINCLEFAPYRETTGIIQEDWRPCPSQSSSGNERWTWR